MSTVGLGSEVWSVVVETAKELASIGPYLAVGVLIGGVIRTKKWHMKMRHALVKHGPFAVFTATLLGVASPLCSCGVLAIVISLLAVGLPLAPAMALLISSPLMSPDGYTLTAWQLGPEWANAKLAAAIFMGLLAGFATMLVERRWFPNPWIFAGAVPDPDFHANPMPHEHLHCDCPKGFGNRVARITKDELKIFAAKTLELAWTAGKLIAIGVLIGVVIRRYVPTDWMTRLFGAHSLGSIVAMVALAAPLYVNQITAAAITYGFIEKGVDPGAAMAFLIGGPVTAIPAMVVLWSMFRKRVFALYLVISVVGSVLVGYAFQIGHGRWPGI